MTLQALALGAVDFIAKPDGTVSLHIDEIMTDLVGKVRNAARARLRHSRGVTQRMRTGVPGPNRVTSDARLVPGSRRVR